MKDANKNTQLMHIAPVLFGFFVMGFCDIVGISSDYAKSSFGWNHAMTGLIPFATFIWFFFLSIPVGIKMSRWGRKNTVLLSLLITIAGMFIPFISFNSYTCITAYACMGIGNAILQVSLNPLLENVITKRSLLTSSLTTGQVIKALSSFLGPYLILFAIRIPAGTDNSYWYYVFPVMGIITLLSAFWLWLTPIEEEKHAYGVRKTTLKETLQLLKNKQIFMLFAGIFFVVGVDVCTNYISSKIMINRFGWIQEEAGRAPQIYFICRTFGALLGAWMLVRVNEIIYFRINIIACIITLLILMFFHNEIVNLACIGAIGFFASCIFPIIYSLAIQIFPDSANQISGLMITAVGGAGIITPIMSVALDLSGLIGGISVILFCVFYLTYCAFISQKNGTLS